MLINQCLLLDKTGKMLSLHNGDQIQIQMKEEEQIGESSQQM